MVGPETALRDPVDAPLTDRQRTAHGLAARAVSVCAGTRELVRELSIGFAAGEMLAILGRNGSGKTLTLHTLAGLRAPAGGEVQLDGHAARTAQAPRGGATTRTSAPGFRGRLCHHRDRDAY